MENSNKKLVFSSPLIKNIFYHGLIKNILQIDVDGENLFGSELLETLDIAQEAVDFLAQKKSNFRAICIYCCYPQYEWESVRFFSILWANFFSDKGIANFCMDIDSGYTLSQFAKRIYTFTDSSLEKALKFENIASWQRYCIWTASEIQKELNSLPHGFVEQFQLEALFEKFLIETKSSFINELEIGISEILLSSYLVELEKEKALINLRLKMEQLLSEQIFCLHAIDKSIQAILPNHNELKKIGQKVKILTLCLEQFSSVNHIFAWDQQLLLFALLNIELDVSMWFYDNQERKKVALAIVTSLLQIKKYFDFEDLLVLAASWDSFKFYEKHDKYSNILQNFQECVFNNLFLLKESKHKLIYITKDFLAFFPKKFALEGILKSTYLISWIEGQKKIKITTAGKAMLQVCGCIFSEL